MMSSAKEAMDAQAPVIEFGKGVSISVGMDKDTPEVASALKFDMDKHLEILDYLKVVKIVEEFHTVNGPVVDKLDRFATAGWYGRFAAPGYTAFAKHFACHKEHVSYDPDLKFIWRMVRLWWSNLRIKEEDNW